MNQEKAHKLATAVYALILAEKNLSDPDLQGWRKVQKEARDARFAELVEAFKEIE